MELKNKFGVAMRRLSKIIIFGFMLVIFCGSGCKAKSSELEKTPERIAVKIYDGFRLSLFLEKSTESKTVSDVEKMLSSKWYGSFIVKDEHCGDKQLELVSCADYLPHKHKRLQPVIAHDRNAFVSLAMPCLAAELISTAKPSAESFIEDLTFDNSLPHSLPPQVALVISETEKNRLLADKSNTSWADIAEISLVSIKSKHKASYKDNSGVMQEVEVVATGDFNNDLIEDILISSSDSVSEGTYFGIRLFLLTKYSRNKKFILLEEISY